MQEILRSLYQKSNSKLFLEETNLDKGFKEGGAEMPEIKYEITENLGVISETSRGWTREVNMISWNGREPKIDVRDWSPDHTKMSKGLTFTKEELVELTKIVSKL